MSPTENVTMSRIKNMNFERHWARPQVEAPNDNIAQQHKGAGGCQVVGPATKLRNSRASVEHGSERPTGKNGGEKKGAEKPEQAKARKTRKSEKKKKRKTSAVVAFAILNLERLVYP